MKTYGGAADEFANAIRQTSDGGYIVAGNTRSFGAGGLDYWVLKLTSSGDIQWQKTYGGTENDNFSSIQQTSDDGYIVAGNTRSFGAGGSDYWVLKLTSSGDVQWQNTYGTAVGESATSIQQTSDDGYIVAGVAGDNYAWILKLSSRVNVQWQKTYGTGNEYIGSIQQTTDDGYVVAGVTLAGDAWIFKLTNSGDIQWQKTSSGAENSYESASSIQQTSDGGYIVAGNISVGVGRDFWVLKVDENGDIPDCSVLRISDASVNDTNAIINSTFSLTTNTAVLPGVFNGLLGDSHVIPRKICPASADEVPIGGIIDWWRPDTSWQVPEGYAICNGGVVDDSMSPLNGMTLPDLTGKFTMGVTDASTIGISGGSTEHNHTVPGITGQTGSISNSHKHRWIQLAITGGGDKQFISWRSDGLTDLMSFWNNGIHNDGAGTYPIAMGPYEQSWYTESAGDSHAHGFTIGYRSTTSSTSLPPYVGLLKIMRIR